ncbi:MAG: T9SS type A sorting domain-containing protein [Candidatus Krumholzibacteriota bacterium]|nr:T9SS type A sorting domain-containing protein [Candidatus Krumholzibacteriota bacterium]
MSKCKRLLGLFLALSVIYLLAAGFLSGSPSFPNEKTIAQDVKMVLNLYSFGPPDTVILRGPSDIEFSDPYPDPEGHHVIDTEIISLNLKGTDIIIRKQEGPISLGSTRSIEPGIDFPAESFFDVFFEVELPYHFPGDTLINYVPLHLTGVVNQYPPYFETYLYPLGSPPILLYSKSGIAVGELLSWEEYILPYYPPRADIQVPTAYRSNVAVVSPSGLIEISAALSGGAELEPPLFAEFSYRHCGETVPFMPFYVDYDGGGLRASTIYPQGEGDGWCAYFDPGSEPFEGQCVQFEVAFHVPPYGIWRDTVDVFVDPTPPIPKFVDFDRDSVGVYHIDSFFDICYQLEDELPAPGTGRAQVFPLVQSFSRELTPVNQLGLGTAFDSVSCGITAAACCLKYMADNGHEELDNPEGDESKPEQSGEDIAKELQGPSGTDATGTTGTGLVNGIKSYLKGHGAEGWDVSQHPVNDEAGLGEMFREMESDSEDVIVLLKDTVTTGEGAGDTLGHFVTLGSREQEQVSEDSTVQRIDFMNPWGGGSTADNKYDVGENSNGEPTTEGFDLDGGAGASARVAGYVKVSPPDGGGGGGGSRSSRPRDGSPSSPGWIPIDMGICHGHGVVDTLHWDTHGFASGLYLLEVITIDDQGHECRDLRLCFIPTMGTGTDPDTPGFKTGLINLYPNPFNPSTNIVFALEKDGPVTMAIYDIAGRRVRMLMAGKRWTAGSHTISWDGKNDRGAQLASGVYFCRFQAEGQASALKMILLR